LEQHLSLPQVSEHPRNRGEKPPRAAKAHAIKAMKDARDPVAETVYKSLHNVALRVIRVIQVKVTLWTRKQRFSFIVVAALPRYVIRGFQEHAASFGDCAADDHAFSCGSGD